MLSSVTPSNHLCIGFGDSLHRTEPLCLAYQNPHETQYDHDGKPSFFCTGWTENTRSSARERCCLSRRWICTPSWLTTSACQQRQVLRPSPSRSCIKPGRVSGGSITLVGTITMLLLFWSEFSDYLAVRVGALPTSAACNGTVNVRLRIGFEWTQHSMRSSVCQ